ncbi:MAG: hypothetical protein WCV68_04605 [Candidatus Paceibacterota bacterium]|jgi:hypothetical protein
MHSVEVPETLTPESVYHGLVFVFVSLFLVSFIFLPFAWAGIFALAVFGALVASGVLAEDIDDWNGAIVFNYWTKTRTRRVMFGGFHWKLPWEHLEETHSLKREVSSGETEVENFATNDPAERMDVLLLIHMRLDTSGTPQEAAARFIRFNSVEDHHLNIIVRKPVIRMFGQYYGGQEMEVLSRLTEVQDAVLDLPSSKKKLAELEQAYGVHIGITLSKSVPDEATRQYKTTPARAEALRTSMDKLMADGNAKLDVEQARKAALLLDPNADFTETHTDWSVEIKAPDLKNLRDINVIPPGMFGDKKGGKK